MRLFALGRGWHGWCRSQAGITRRGAKHSTQASSSGQSSPAQPGGYWSNPVLKAGITSGSLSLAGDVLAQLFTQRSQGGLVGASHLDLQRSARMGSYGLLFYGPYQHWWYSLLGQSFPQHSTAHFLSKVALNQLVLAPVVLTTVFAWNLLLTQKADEITSKIKRDLVPTMINGWKFWIPASSINFWLIPVRSQVLYMSACGLLWTAYLSYSSNRKMV